MISLHWRIWLQYCTFEQIWFMSKTFLELVYFVFPYWLHKLTWLLSSCLKILLSLFVKPKAMSSFSKFFSRPLILKCIILISCFSLLVGRCSRYFKSYSEKQSSPRTSTYTSSSNFSDWVKWFSPPVSLWTGGRDGVYLFSFIRCCRITLHNGGSKICLACMHKCSCFLTSCHLFLLFVTPWVLVNWSTFSCLLTIYIASSVSC